MYIKGHVSIKMIKGMHVCMMLKGSKQALTVLHTVTVTHVKEVKRSLNCFNCYSCRRGQKWCLWLLYNTVYRVMLSRTAVSRNIKETFLPKTGMQKKQVLQDTGYVEGVKSAFCMLHVMLQGCMKYPMLLMSKGSKVHLIYNVDSNMKSSNYMPFELVKL